MPYEKNVIDLYHLLHSDISGLGAGLPRYARYGHGHIASLDRQGKQLWRWTCDVRPRELLNRTVGTEKRCGTTLGRRKHSVGQHIPLRLFTCGSGSDSRRPSERQLTPGTDYSEECQGNRHYRKGHHRWSMG